MSAAAILRTTLKHLTEADADMLLGITESRIFAKNEMIIDSGSGRRALYFITDGSARIVRSHLGQDIVVTRVGAGELVGELAYLMHGNSVSRIYADEETQVRVMQEESLNSLLSSVPGLGTRFFQSLAARVAWKLRDTSQQIPLLAVEDIPQVNRFHAARSSASQAAALPAALTEGVEQFKEAMLTIDQGLLKKKIDQPTALAGVAQASSAFNDLLRHHVESEKSLEKQIGAYVFRETFPLVMTSQLNDLAYSKPRGYAGDYSMIDVIYANTPTGSGRLGPLIDAWLLDHSCSHAVKNRRALLKDSILTERANYRGPNGMPMLTLACGPARELLDVFTEQPDIALDATCVDIDHEALAHASQLLMSAGAHGKVRFFQDNVIKLAGGRGKITVPKQQLIYSIGLTDYLQEQYVISLLDWAYDNLLDGGQLVIGNFATGNPGKAYMDHMMEWQLIHRTPAEMQEMFAKSKFGNAPVEVRAEKAGINLFAFGRKV